MKETTYGDRIRQMSNEELASVFVVRLSSKWENDDYPYYSTLTGTRHKTHEEAIESTLYRLNE